MSKRARQSYLKLLDNHKRKQNVSVDGEDSVLKEAVLQLINYHHSSDRTLAETSSLLADNEKDKKLSRVLESLKSSLHGRSESFSIETCAFKLLDLIRKCESNSGCPNVDLKAEIQIILQIVQDLLKNGKFNRQHFCSLLCKESCLPLDVIWILHTAGIITIDEYLARKELDSSFVGKAARLLCVGHSEEEVTDSITGFVGCLSSMAFPEDSEADKSVSRKVSIDIIDAVIKCQLEEMLASQCYRYLPVSPLKNNMCHNVKKQYTHVLSLILHHQPMKLDYQILEQQVDWTYTKSTAGLLAWYKQLLLVLEAEDITQLLHQILERQTINWKMLLTFVSTYLLCIPQASSHIHDLVSCWLRRGLEESEIEHILVGFLLARQACSEGCHVFMSYNDWFQKTFGDSKSLAGSRKCFIFFLKFLTDIVPHEMPLHLKTHILRPPFVPPKCREFLGDYIMLAKTRLADLKQPLDLTSVDDADKSKIMEQVERDVLQSVTIFQTSAKIPSSVMEASIFRKPYFIGRFLPALLKPRTLPDEPDARMKFIEALKRVDKIPVNMHAIYLNACKQEAAKLLQGVFEEEDDEDDMIMEPVEQLQHRLGQLEDIVLRVNGQLTKTEPQMQIPEVLSFIREKMCTVLNTEAADSGHCPTVLIINVHSADLSMVHVQVVDAVLNVMCKLATACLQSEQPDMNWAQKFIAVISEFPVLHKALVTRIWKLVTENGPGLELHHINGLSMTVCLLSALHDKFSSVAIQECNQTDVSPSSTFAHLLWSALPCYSAQWMNFVLRLSSTYLQCLFSCLDDLKISQLVEFVLPRPLVKKYEFLCYRLLSEFGGDMGTSDFRLAHVIYRSKMYNKYCQSMKLTFEDWVLMELMVHPDKDCLCYSKRQEYIHWSVHQRYMKLPVKEGGCGHDYRLSCSVLLKILLKWDISSRMETTVHCGNCNTEKTCSYDTGGRAMFVSQLQIMVNYLTFEKCDTGTDIPWLLQELAACCSHVGESSRTVATMCFIRIAMCLPGNLFFMDSACQVLDSGFHSSCEVIKNQLRQHLGEGCHLPADVTLYLLQGLIQCPKHVDIGRILIKCPLLVTSIMVHIEHTAALVDQCVKNGRPLDQGFVSIFLWLRRGIDGDRNQRVEPDHTHPWITSAALMALSLHSEKLVKQVVLDLGSQLNKETTEVNAYVEECLGTFMNLLLGELTHRNRLPSLQVNTGLQELLILMVREFSWLLSLILSTENKHHQLMSDSIHNLRHFTMLQILESCGIDLILELPNGINCIIIMFSNIVKKFEDGQASESHRNKTVCFQDLLSLADFIKACIRKSQPNQVKGLDQQAVRECGTDIMIVLNDRLSGVK